jgi:hypothetical protein
MPLLIGGTYLLFKAWLRVKGGLCCRTILSACATAMVFILAISVKAIVQYVFYALLVLFFIDGVRAYARREHERGRERLVYAVLVLVMVQSFVLGYMGLNKHFNGHFAFTDRATGLLYGNAVKRAAPLTSRVALAHIASIPGDGVCLRFSPRTNAVIVLLLLQMGFCLRKSRVYRRINRKRWSNERPFIMPRKGHGNICFIWG